MKMKHWFVLEKRMVVEVDGIEIINTHDREWHPFAHYILYTTPCTREKAREISRAFNHRYAVVPGVEALSKSEQEKLDCISWRNGIYTARKASGRGYLKKQRTQLEDDNGVMHDVAFVIEFRDYPKREFQKFKREYIKKNNAVYLKDNKGDDWYVNMDIFKRKSIMLDVEDFVRCEYEWTKEYNKTLKNKRPLHEFEKYLGINTMDVEAEKEMTIEINNPIRDYQLLNDDLRNQLFEKEAIIKHLQMEVESFKNEINNMIDEFNKIHTIQIPATTLNLIENYA